MNRLTLSIPLAARNVISIAGAVLTTVSALLFLVVYLSELFGLHTNPYLGIVIFLVLPGVFVAGLLMIPIGIWRERRLIRSGVERKPVGWPVLNLNDPHQRKVTLAVAALTFVNVVIISLATFKGIEYMDSVAFCGQVCHEVMQPQFVSHQSGPHARVACVQCHIGPGAPWFVRSKLSGTRQLFAVAFNTHSRPIPSPVHNLRPARDTCEQCHWPAKFHGDIIRAFREYGNDAQVSETVTVMRVHVGGGIESLGPARGIHWHTSASNVVEYIATDDKREVIPWVRLTSGGVVKEWTAEGVTPEMLARGERRVMDCVDCHNRPAHTFSPTVERAVDRAISVGVIDRSLPFVRREAVRVLKQEYQSQEAARRALGEELTKFYRDLDPQAFESRSAAVARSIEAVRELYDRNVFPSMKVTWGTYTNNVGHTDFPGCFRCHDESHTAKDGTTISQDCEMCHTQEEIPAPAATE
jgi:nitrate/TMAO reductase-like tetraheme cytochrome c subunit